MEEKALKLFSKAWDRIKDGEFFDDGTNTTFDYMLKSLWNTDLKSSIKADILKNFPKLYSQTKDFDRLPPLFYILISLKDSDIIKEMQSILIIDWIKSNASEGTTFQLLNFTDTFFDKQIPITNFVNTIIKRISSAMNQDMVEALSHMITIQHPEFMVNFLKKFLSMSDRDDTLLKNYVQMVGRKAFLELMKIATPEQMNKIFKQLKK